MGTPEFAVAPLRALVERGDDVVGVVTATDKLGGRGGKQLLQPAVKKYALQRGILVLQPRNLKSKKFLAELRDLRADLQVVVAFRMLPQLVWAMPPLGTINLHGSLLPAYRGAAPIHWAVINGETTTGVSTFFLEQDIDTGDLLLQRELNIGPNETTGSVHDRMMALGAQTVLESIDLIAQGKTTGTPQDDSRASHAPKLTHDTARVDWSLSDQKLHDFVRGMSPYPAAWTVLDGREMKVLLSQPVAGAIAAEAIASAGAVLPQGYLVPLDKSATYRREAPGLAVTTGSGLLELLTVKPAGKGRMSGLDLRNGLRLTGPRPLTTEA